MHHLDESVNVKRNDAVSKVCTRTIVRRMYIHIHMYILTQRQQQGKTVHCSVSRITAVRAQGATERAVVGVQRI